MQRLARQWRSQAIAWPLIVLCASSGFTATVQAEQWQEVAPNLQPLAGLFLTHLPGATSADWRADLHTASHSAEEQRGSSAALFDGETSILVVGARWQLSPRLQIDWSLPYVWHSAGVLDRFIDGWHQTFGLPEGIRDERPRDALEFDLRNQGARVVDVTRNLHGSGDLRIAAVLALGDDDAQRGGWHLSAAVKLPTGDAKRLTGSGGSDLGIALHWRSSRIAASRWQFAASGGAVVTGRSDFIAIERKPLVVSASGSARYSFGERFSLGAKLQAATATLETPLHLLGEPSLQLITGGEWQWRPHWSLAVSVSEDLAVERSPDVTIRIGVRRRY